MPSVRSVLSVLLAVLPVGAAGCDDAGLPFLEGTYQLVRAEGDPLPFSLWDSEAEGMTLLDERLMFRPDGTVERRTLRRFREGNPAQVREEWHVVEQEYRLVGRSIAVGWFTPCPPNALCIGNDTGRAGVTRVVLQSVFHTVAQGGLTLEYLRQ